MSVLERDEDVVLRAMWPTLPFVARVAGAALILALAYLMLTLQLFQPKNHLLITVVIVILSGLAAGRALAVAVLRFLLAMMILPPQIFAVVTG